MVFLIQIIIVSPWILFQMALLILNMICGHWTSNHYQHVTTQAKLMTAWLMTRITTKMTTELALSPVCQLTHSCKINQINQHGCIYYQFKEANLNIFTFLFFLWPEEKNRYLKVFLPKLVRNSPYSVLPASFFNKKEFPLWLGNSGQSQYFNVVCTRELSTAVGNWTRPAQDHTS